MANAIGGRDGQVLAMQNPTPPLAAHPWSGRPVVPRMPRLLLATRRPSSSQPCLNCPMPVSYCLAGRCALPLEPGTVDTEAWHKAPRGKRTEPTKSAMHQGRRPRVGSGAGLVGGVLAAGGRACRHRPARSLHPGRGGRLKPARPDRCHGPAMPGGW